MYRIMHQAGTFAINILSEHQGELSRHFAGAEAGPPPESLHFEPEPDNGAPFIRDTLGAIRCRIEREVDVGDHVIVLGRVVQLREAPPAPPLIYFGGHYSSLRDLEAADSAHDVWNPDAVRAIHKA
jgi:flavin reductase (DIM6/NTAB) family NADH-FMN oxidoreductase RutF